MIVEPPPTIALSRTSTPLRIPTPIAGMPALQPPRRTSPSLPIVTASSPAIPAVVEGTRIEQSPRWRLLAIAAVVVTLVNVVISVAL